MANAEMLQPSLGWSAFGSDFLIKEDAGSDLYVAGYASVDMVDKQGDRIPTAALKKAFGKFMVNKAYRNVQLAHSGIQVGEVVDSYSDSQGRMWKSEVDDHGLFVVCKIRSDIQKAREVQKQVRDGDHDEGEEGVAHRDGHRSVGVPERRCRGTTEARGTPGNLHR